MSSCLSGGGRAYTLDLQILKSPSNSWISNSPSPSSTLSESSNSSRTISTRKPRTQRKRPNQTFNEAAAILSTAYPKIFSTKHLTKPGKFTKLVDKNAKNHPLLFEPSDLLMPFRIIDNSDFLLHPPVLERPIFQIESKIRNPFEKTCESSGEIDSSYETQHEYQEDFDAESILDEEIEEGIDSIMGNLSMDNRESVDGSSSCSTMQMNTCCYGYPVGLGFEFGLGIRRELRAMRNVDEGNWWSFPRINVLDKNPKVAKNPSEKKKKKVEKKVEIKNLENSVSPSRGKTKNSSVEATSEEDFVPQLNSGLLLKLNYDNVLNEWSDKGSPFSGDAPGCESAGNDVQARLAQIDLFSETGVERNAVVIRYKEKRRTRLFSKKIRYQVRKIDADQRPRMKGRFVRTPDSPENEQEFRIPPKYKSRANI